MSKPVYLGKLLLHWCSNCNVPVLGKKCSCGESTQKVEVTPPGDIRPAFQYDIDNINAVSMKQFNAPLIPEGHLVVMNKAPYDDRMEEIIVDGEVLASIRFEIEKLQWVLLPRLPGARRLFEGKDLKDMRGWVVLDSGAVNFILKGASVLAPGIVDADPEIQNSDETVVLTPEGDIIAAGRARMSGADMLEHKRGVGVKTRWKGKPEKLNVPEGGQTWDDAVEANSEILDRFEEKAHSFIKNVNETVKKPVTVSYSGGKDSLAVLQLTSECLENYDLLFADTGLEFPETIENVKEIEKLYNRPLRTKDAKEAFWDSVDNFGPPSVEARWCCKVCKLGPITQIIEENYENGCLTFIGQRKYESDARAKSERVWKNPWVGNQVGASPIQDWTAMHVWLYIFKTKVPYNVMYERGFDRIGCWLCPSSSLADIVRLKETHPQMEKRLNDYLLEYAERMGLSKEWVDHGLWRWQTLPPAIAEVAKQKGINIIPKSEVKGDLNFAVTSGYRPCREGGMSAEGSFGIALDMELIESTGQLRAAGKPAYIEGVASVQHEDDRAQIFASGTITARGNDEKSARKFMTNVERSVRRALKCMGCGVCVGKCPNNSITIKDEKAVIGKTCIHCGACIDICPIVKFG
ncbi:phosphoadenosine phosphosulfate reductase family protein [Methanococcoides orientis]|uniref:phosphoadenosine phosphosulfate reductase domain-containing protein n=1 Tax=Methanococcoides orientis TaxID=2822137 RepID=UPI001E327DCD|nr:phosphoadenosine phosphosulfate reductase family protein [Methanococcoides orientis]UGV40540.1 phosphoadenosine phosphosulfate reductase family protein [Methanococcoides orientis]